MIKKRSVFGKLSALLLVLTPLIAGQGFCLFLIGEPALPEKMKNK